MRRTNELERRLKEWADEYRDSWRGIGWAGKSFLDSMIEYGGRSPQGLNQSTAQLTPADEVESAVSMLEKQLDGFRPARVIRCEYFSGKNDAEKHKLDALEDIGLRMSRTTYYDELWVARTHVAAWLRIPASVDLLATAIEVREK